IARQVRDLLCHLLVAGWCPAVALRAGTWEGVSPREMANRRGSWPQMIAGIRLTMAARFANWAEGGALRGHDPPPQRNRRTPLPVAESPRRLSSRCVAAQWAGPPSRRIRPR